jgi:hypothetical protein
MRLQYFDVKVKVIESQEQHWSVRYRPSQLTVFLLTFINNAVSPRLTWLRPYVFCPQAKRTYAYLWCWNPMIRHRCWSILLNFWSKESLNKLRNLNLSLRRGSWQFWSWKRAFDVLKLASRCSGSLIGTSSCKDQARNYEDACLLWMWKTGLCLARLQCLVSSFQLQEL